MIWLTSFSFLLVLLLARNDCVESRRSPGATNSPWADEGKANNFMRCVLQDIATSPVFPQQENDDMESIVETMMADISSMKRSRIQEAQFQALNMAFASSLAEIVIAADAENMTAVQVKTNALAQSQENCLESTMGTVNRRFIDEMKDLISVLTEEASAEEREIDFNDQKGGVDFAVGKDVGVSGDLGSLLSSPSDLSPPRASGIIQALAKGVLNSFRPDGLDVSSFAQSLGALISTLIISSGLSPAQAQLEALMETLVALAQILSSSLIGQVDFSNTSALSSSVQRFMENVFE